MLLTLLRLWVTQPQLLADHAQAYVTLARAEFECASAAWMRRLLLSALCIGCLIVAAMLAGVALMLWAVTPAAVLRAPWALWGTPLLPIAAALWCWFKIRPAAHQDVVFSALRQQLRTDVDILRKSSAS